MAGVMRLFQLNSQDSYRGRLSGALATVQGVALLAGTLCAGFLVGGLALLAVPRRAEPEPDDAPPAIGTELAAANA
jgi:hypothetical protein